MRLVNGYWIIADACIPRYKRRGKFDWFLRLIPPLFRKIEAKRPWRYKMIVIEMHKTVVVHPDVYETLKEAI